MSLLCPKCTNAMRQYERNDVIIDQCVECGGIFLDRGELERLAQAEANFYNPQAAQPLPPRPEGRSQDARRHDDDRRHHDLGRDSYDARRYDDRSRDSRYDDRRYDDRDDRRYRDDKYRDDRYRDDKYYDKHGRKKRKRGSFFEDVFDLIGD